MPRAHNKPIPSLTEADIARFWSKVDQGGGPDACHLWLAGKQRPPGLPYGKFTVQHTITLAAHRVAYYLSRGVDPGDLEVCHNCPAGDNPACCNDNHLWLGTAADNNADCVKKGRNATGDNSGARKHPEKLKRGAEHHVRKNPALMKPALDAIALHPELHSRGDDHYTRLRPELVHRGEGHCKSKLTDAIVLEIRRRYAAGGTSLLKLAKEFNVAKRTVLSVLHRKTWRHVL